MRKLKLLSPVQDAHVVYEGASQIDPTKPIVAIVTGLTKPSKNAKTGPMAQLWILDASAKPSDAQASGADASVCGSCAFRPLLLKQAREAGTAAPRYGCYVKTWRGPNHVYQAYKAGRYGSVDLKEAELAIARSGRSLRLGAYGDPAALPMSVLEGLTSAVALGGRGWTGYTHQWREARFSALSGLLMASCETPADLATCEALGWRGFVVLDGGKAGPTHEPGPAAKTGAVWLGLWSSAHTVACPNVTYGTACADCKLCDGRQHDKPRAHVAIAVHM